MRLQRLFAPMLIVFVGFGSGTAAAGTLHGKVVFEGISPEPVRTEVKSDTTVCGTHQETPLVTLGSNGGVANAVVTVIGAAGAAAAGAGRLDQVGCQFVPHVQALPVGSKLIITSSDPVLHNAHGFYEDGSTAFNIAVPIAGMELAQKLEKPGVIKLRCDAGHTWMKGFIAVLPGAHFAVTDADGNFSIKGVPAGRYEVEVWHEWLGRRREPVEVGKDGAEGVTLVLKENTQPVSS